MTKLRYVDVRYRCQSVHGPLTA